MDRGTDEGADRAPACWPGPEECFRELIGDKLYPRAAPPGARVFVHHIGAEPVGIYTRFPV